MTIGMEPADLPVPGAKSRVVLHTDVAGRFVLRSSDGLEVEVDGRAIPPEGSPVVAGVGFDVFGRTFVIESEPGHTRPGPAEFNRPPRPVLPYVPSDLEPPAPPQEIAKPMRFGWGALVIPLLLGLGMAVLIHPRMAVFALFSPAMLLANWTEDRRRVRRERRESGRVFAEALGSFEAHLEQACRQEADHRWVATTSPEEASRRASVVDARLWERRIPHNDFLALPLGTGCVPWTPSLADRPCPETAAVVSRYSELHGVPVVIQPRPGDVVGIAGDRVLALGIVRQLVVQAAVHHGPADLSIWIFTETAADWDWAKWLPHVVVDSSGRRRVAATVGEIESLAALFPDRDADDQRRHLFIVDLPDLAAGPRAKIREALRDGSKRGIAAVAVSRRSIDLPSLATTVVSAMSRETNVRFPDGSGVVVTPWTAGTPLARRVARNVARVRDPEAITLGSDLPDVVHLASLLGLGDDVSSAIVEKWRRPGNRPVALLGSTEDGRLEVDLVGDGPHALLGGTTGSGKSELLRTLVASLAVSSSPEVLNFVLVDYKGGSAFDACSELPHTVGLVTDLDDHLAKRALSCLDAELRYREQRLRDAAVSDIDAYFALGAAPLPRLLVVVDEFAALATELPDFMDALVGIAQRGRSLGVHLLLATQRPNGVISDNIKANTNLRIALRVQDSSDSVDVIGVAHAADVPGSLPGRGLARLGPRDVVPFQTALVTGTSMVAAVAAVGVAPFTFVHEQVAPAKRDVAKAASPTDLELVVAACVEAAEKTSVAQPRLPWPAPLPTLLARQALPTGSAQSGVATYGLADEPHRQRTMPASWAPTSGNL
ncbi:MAG: hypothetical protein GY722_01935, partial [bacterium]|nr:hypothetical protein [bacterium]